MLTTFDFFTVYRRAILSSWFAKVDHGFILHNNVTGNIVFKILRNAYHNVHI